MWAAAERSADWMRQAERNPENAESELRGGFHEWVCFLSQQAAEKVGKVVFQRLGAEAFGYSADGTQRVSIGSLSPFQQQASKRIER